MRILIFFREVVHVMEKRRLDLLTSETSTQLLLLVLSRGFTAVRNNNTKKERKDEHCH